MQWKLFCFFCRKLYYFKLWCITDHQNVSRLTSHNINYIGCVFHCIEASEAVVPQLLMSAKQSSNMITVGWKWNGHHWNFFTFFFTDKFNAVIHAIKTWKVFQLYTHLCYVLKWTIQRWNLSSRISRTRFKFSNYCFKVKAPLAGSGRVWGLRLTMLPHAPSYSLSPTLLPCCQAFKRVLMIFIIFIYMMGLESQLW